jgi:dihydroorotate dehydrogenase electron transfer subunit
VTGSPVTTSAQNQRASLFVEDALITAVSRFPDNQFILRLQAPKCASRATAGSFIHLRCDDTIPMRRPLSIMRANPSEGWIEILFKIVGEGLRALGAKKVGDSLSCIGPIGKGFTIHEERPQAVLIGGGVGIPPMIFLAEQMLRDGMHPLPLVLMGSELPFPFDCCESKIAADWLDEHPSQTIVLLEERDICARLASLSDFAGVYRGYVTGLARRFLDSQTASALARTELFACGPTPMLEAVAALAREFDLPCQVSLEEFMACAVGGCAGCAVRVQTSEGPAMKRVCVDGPVFDASQVFGVARQIVDEQGCAAAC